MSENNAKYDFIVAIAKPLYEAGENKEKIAEKLILDGILSRTEEPRFAFTEVFNLVVACGKNLGFIKTPEQMKADAKAEIEAHDLTTVNTFELMEQYVSDMIAKHSTPQKWTLDTVKAAYTLQGLSVPKKSTLTPWQAATIEAFIANPAITQNELDAVIKPHVQNFAHYSNLVHGLCSGIASHYVDAMKAAEKKGGKK